MQVTIRQAQDGLRVGQVYKVISIGYDCFIIRKGGKPFCISQEITEYGEDVQEQVRLERRKPTHVKRSFRNRLNK